MEQYLHVQGMQSLAGVLRRVQECAANCDNGVDRATLAAICADMASALRLLQATIRPQMGCPPCCAAAGKTAAVGCACPCHDVPCTDDITAWRPPLAVVHWAGWPPPPCGNQAPERVTTAVPAYVTCQDCRAQLLCAQEP